MSEFIKTANIISFCYYNWMQRLYNVCFYEILNKKNLLFFMIYRFKSMKNNTLAIERIKSLMYNTDNLKIDPRRI